MDEFTDRLIALEIKFDERWTSHDKRSEENWQGIKYGMQEISGKLNSLQCKVHEERFTEMSNSIKETKDAISRIKGCAYSLVVLILGGFITLVFKIAF